MLNGADRRNYARLIMSDDVGVTLYPNHEGQPVWYEATGHISDISEYGIGIFIECDEQLMKQFHKDDVVQVQFMDSLDSKLCSDTFIIVTPLRLRHIQFCENGLAVGGIVNNENYHNYYLKRELVNMYGRHYGIA